MSLKNRIITAMPIMCIIAYLLVGYLLEDKYDHIWFEALPIFVLIPISLLLLVDNIFSVLYPIICVALYVLAGVIFQHWHPAWIILLTIPVFYIIFGPYVCNIKIKRG